MTIELNMNSETEYDKVKRIICACLDREPKEVGPFSNLYEMGADSLDYINICQAIEQEFGITITDEEGDNIKTVQDAATMVARKKAM